MVLYNTLTRKKATLRPIKGKKVRMYTCGPTVYLYAHLGNFRTFIFYDFLRRALDFSGYEVKHVMNITDVGHLTSDADSGEDKLEKSAKHENKTAWDIAKFYTAAFLRDAKKLNLLPPTKIPKASRHIKEQIKLIETLEKKGYTYKISDGVYFDTSKFKRYGKLSRQKLDEKKAGARVDVGGKRNFTDFALWKFSPEGKTRDMEWDSHWGRGFPGWHIECSAMSREYLGQPFEIHAGGIDHLTVHHENEIAQSVAAYGKELAKIWMHGEFLVLGKHGRDKRMGKSEGNLRTVSELEILGIDPLAYRYLCLTTHYRKKLYYSDEALEASRKALTKLREIYRKLPTSAKSGVLEVEREFAEALNDDLDLPRALGLTWKMVRDKKFEPAQIKSSLKKFDRVFGLDLGRQVNKILVPESVDRLVEEREKARREKDWSRADEIRRKIKKAGFEIRDSKSGQNLEPISK